MLYVTTRNSQEAFPANPVLTQSRGAEGGLFIPLKLPQLSPQECRRLLQMPFGQCAAEMLNLFFGTKLTQWDVDFSVGRYPVRIEQLPHRIFLAEAWHNPEGKYSRLEKNLLKLLDAEGVQPGNWPAVAARMAVLAGILGSGEFQETEPKDIAVVSGDFTLPISAWYLRKMGFPIGNIICCCNENNQFWDLLCNGQMHTDALSVCTIVPEADVALPVNLERLISDCAGAQETRRYLECCRTGRVYGVSDMLLQKLRSGMHVSVVSSSRVETTIPNVYRTHNYVLSPASALAYGGLLDYRAKTGITRTAVVLCDASPLCYGETVAKALELPAAVLKNLF